ncbi:FMN-dependent oxidoreductase (nitrilotriacetate monooxygenase family) [Rhodococcus sp. 27YEA15]|uniref:NtaA/DmoA family FMN-dependent monooxygenase n=1 Tax=Rhodococcus sp. 27YEA15 TaxID=3156259 RepID=UPI003C7EA57C
MTEKVPRQVHLGVQFPGVNSTTVWSDPESGSHIDFASFAHLARTVEAAKFDFLFLAEGLRLRERNGSIHDLDVVGRPDTLPVLSALASVTTHLGLIGTINSTFNEPYELARQFASLDHLSAGRAGWNVVTSSDAFTGANFRRGGYLALDQRYDRARESVEVVRTLWDSWDTDAVVADGESGRFWKNPEIGRFRHSGKHFEIEGQFAVPASPQRHPVLIQAGNSEDGRDFGGTYCDAIFTLMGDIEDDRRFYREVKARKVAAGGTPDELLILPAAYFALGDTTAEAHEKAAAIRRQQISGQTAIQFIERIWNRDLSSYDPDGPLPAVDPDVDAEQIMKGMTHYPANAVEIADGWRELAVAKGFSIRDLAVELSAKQPFIGTASEVADQINHYVQTGASDGFILIPHISPTGMDEFARTVVPELQERGVFRTDYTGTTLRDHLGLAADPPRRSARTSNGASA